MCKRALLLSVMLSLVLSASVAAAPPDPVALVNGEPISRSEFLGVLEQVAGAQILDRLITIRLLLQANRRDHLVEAQEIDQEFSAIKGQFPGEAEFAAALKDNGLTSETLRQQIEAKLVLERLAVKGITVTEQEIASYFAEHQNELDEPELVRASHILVASEEEAKQVLSELANGADFGKLAAERSLDPGSRERGGELGLFARGEMVPEFEEAAFATQPGGLSGPVKSQFGWHVIKVSERKPPVPATLDSSRQRIQQLLLKQKTRADADVLAELRSQGEIKVYWE